MLIFSNREYCQQRKKDPWFRPTSGNIFIWYRYFFLGVNVWYSLFLSNQRLYICLHIRSSNKLACFNNFLSVAFNKSQSEGFDALCVPPYPVFMHFIVMFSVSEVYKVSAPFIFIICLSYLVGKLTFMREHWVLTNSPGQRDINQWPASITTLKLLCTCYIGDFRIKIMPSSSLSMFAMVLALISSKKQKMSCYYPYHLGE